MTALLLDENHTRLILIDSLQQLIPRDQNRKAGNYFSCQIEYRRNVIFLKLSAHRLSHFLPHAPLRGNLWNRLSDVARIGVSHIEGMTVGKDGFRVASTCTSSVYLFSATRCPRKKEKEKSIDQHELIPQGSVGLSWGKCKGVYLRNITRKK